MYCFICKFLIISHYSLLYYSNSCRPFVYEQDWISDTFDKSKSLTNSTGTTALRDHSSCALKTLHIKVNGTRIVFSGLFGIKKQFPGVLALKTVMPRLGTREWCHEPK